MPSKVASLLLLTCSSTSANNAAFKITPVEKVLDLLTKLDAQVVADGQKEAEQYDNYACFCKEQADGKKYMIDKSTDIIARQDAEIAKLDAQIIQLNTDIGTLNTQITTATSDIANLDKQRASDHKSYLATDDHITTAITAVEGAIKALNDSKAQMTGDVDLDSRESLLQLSHVLSTSSGTVHAIGMSALSQIKGPPSGQAAAYQYQSNTKVIAVLQKLKKDFLAIKKTQDDAEFQSNVVFDTQRNAQARTKKFAEADKEEKLLLESQKSKQKADTEKERQQEASEKQADEKFLGVLQGDCEEKAKQWDQRSQSRSDELAAINDAKKVLMEGNTKGSSEEVVSVAESFKSNEKLVAPSFLQLRGTRSSAASRVAAERVHSFLVKQAESISSPALSMLSAKVSGVPVDRFVKVRALIKDLMARLKSDAQAEQTRKAFCDKEMTDAIGRRDVASQDFEQAESSIAQLSASKAQKQQIIAEQSEDKANNEAAKKKAIDQRAAESKANDNTLLDAKAGKAAVEQAILILEKYYAKALLQESYTPYVAPDSDREGKTVSDRQPEIWSGEYGGQKKSSKGIIGLLEVILADFDRTIAATDAIEIEQGAAFTTFKDAAEADIKANQQLIDSNTNDVGQIDTDLVSKTGDKNTANGLKDGANKELDGLKSSCVDGEETYAQRVAKRDKEIAALKRALVILDEWQS